MWDAIVVGSGYGGCVAARELANRGKKVIVLETGKYMPHNDAPDAFGSIINRMARIVNNRPIVVGGGSNVNFAVWFTPSKEDAREAFGPEGLHALEPFRNDVAASYPFHLEAYHPLEVRVFSALSNALGMTWAKDLGPSGTVDAYKNKVYKAGTLNRPTSGQRVGVEVWLNTLSKPPVIHTSTQVTMVAEREGGGYIVHTASGVRYEAETVFLAAGTLSTPGILLRSKLSRGLSSHVGRHLRDHNMIHYVTRVPTSHTASSLHGKRFAQCTISAEKRLTVGDTPFSVHMLGNVGEDCVSASTIFAVLITHLCPCDASQLFGAVPSTCVCDKTFDKANCDICCLVPCGLSRYFNPLECVGCAHMGLIVGGVTGEEGHVTVDNNGRTNVTYPKLTHGEQSALKDHIKRIRHALVSDGLPSGCASKRPDTEWHHVGTVRAHDALDDHFQVRDEQGVPYTGLHVADNSAARKPSAFNTGALAALAGYVAARQSLAPYELTMVRG